MREVLLFTACLALGLGALWWTQVQRLPVVVTAPPAPAPAFPRTPAGVVKMLEETAAPTATAPQPAAPPPANDPVDPEPKAKAFQARLDAARRVGAEKGSLAALLADWRSGDLTREQDRAIDDLIAAQGPSDELDKAAAHLLLRAPDAPAQRQALAALLANSASDHAVGTLLEAAKDARLSADALAALATVSEPGALPLLGRAIERSAAPELLDAIARALRNVDTAKARDLEARLAAVR